MFQNNSPMLKDKMENLKKYLPSKKFTHLIMWFGVLGILFLIVFFLFSSKNHFGITAPKTDLQIGNLTVNDLVQKDSDGDGVPDWEEALWGTDPHNKATFNGVPDATYIADKKKALSGNGDTDTSLTETDKFAQEFFSAFTAMKAAGQDSTTINNFSSSLGQNIINPNLTDAYTINDVKVDNNNETSDTRNKYYTALKQLFDKYKTEGLGDELDIVSSQLNSSSDTSNNPGQSDKLLAIGKAYQDFATSMMVMSVPASLTQYHLDIANGANNTGVSVINMAKISGDPIVGLSGLSQYQKYSGDFVTAVENLQTDLGQ
jgi:hypothetical protein